MERHTGTYSKTVSMRSKSMMVSLDRLFSVIRQCMKPEIYLQIIRLNITR